jgi:malonyl-CoA O-methyltransferase
MTFFNRKKPEKIEIQQGYNLWSADYAKEKNPIKSASDESVKGLLPDLTGKSVIDVGCGTGYFCQYAEQAGAKSITGIDFSEGMIAQAKQNCERTHFITAQIQDLQLNENADVIICALVLGHLRELKPAISAFARNLRVGGLLILTDFHPLLSERGQKRTFQAGRKIFEIPHYIHPLQQYRDHLKEAGFVLEEMKEPTWKEIPVIFALRARKGLQP